jgi:hypothetical protein
MQLQDQPGELWNRDGTNTRSEGEKIAGETPEGIFLAFFRLPMVLAGRGYRGAVCSLTDCI